MVVAQAWNTAELVAKDKAHLLHPVSNLKQVRENGPLVLARGEGVYLWDTDGKQYIDAFAGLWNVNVGHGRHELAEAAAEQIDEVAFVPTFFGLASPPAIELAAKLAELFPGDLNHFHFTSGGAESNETALKIARYYWCLEGQAGQDQDHLPQDGLPRHRHGRARRDRHPHLPRGVRSRRAGLRPRHRALRLPQRRRV